MWSFVTPGILDAYRRSLYESGNAQSALGGRFSESTDSFVQAFTASVEFDQRMAREDIHDSIAHASMLAEQRILTDKELQTIIEGLCQIETEIESGQFTWSIAREDVHMNIESRLIDLIGDTGKNFHTGRSRMTKSPPTSECGYGEPLITLYLSYLASKMGLIALAEREADSIMPGFTPSSGQPVTFGHHMLAWNEMLERDAGRLLDCRKRMNQCPLAAKALAGTSYPINRERTAELLGLINPQKTVSTLYLIATSVSSF